ncbi:T9SS type A sorting domain-containing protein [Pontibacter cellulosilyticus]|uniref:T9SS type A sorting domain-containing protein n=1 Tax=Pontibacter cellulosilyticus TaxID=1720253 RepID=A0A923N838_9BACT|nr:T9SS type A sorting domain-containing protein [Pontibacter cellulosilyticus]MBC5993151.1 T9SS type A sorting domain-containing protein [Pontibacter cellulosilyticus]
MKTRLLLLLAVVILLASSTTFATHISGGYISYKVDPQNPLKYEFTLTIFENAASNADEVSVQISMGDLNQVTIVKTETIVYSHAYQILKFKWEHTYQQPGNYVVSWKGVNRNPNIVNVTQPSDQLSIFVYTEVQPRLNPLNRHSIKTIVPAPLEAFTGEPFKTNLIAYDADGDKLTYELVIPQHVNQNFIPQNLPGYQFPVGLHINKFGELQWQNPMAKGEYAIAVKITEYKENQPTGYVIVDMQLHVKDRVHEPIVKLLNKDRLTINYDGSVYAKPEQLLKLEFFVEKAPNSTNPVYAKQFSDLDTLDLATPDFAARDSANGLAVTLRLTPGISIARNQPYIIGLRGSTSTITSQMVHQVYGWDFVNVYIGAQQPTSIRGDLPEQANLLVYPNPSTNKLVIEGDNLQGGQLKVFNRNGQQAFSYTLKEGSNTIKRPSHVPAGVYVYYIYKNGKAIKAGKLVLE